jgi:hypothetical protein
MHERYVEQVRLLMRALPSIAEEKVFALKGGSAINLFYRNMPRLSVDIDLVYPSQHCRDLQSQGHSPDRGAGRSGIALRGCRGHLLAGGGDSPNAGREAR